MSDSWNGTVSSNWFAANNWTSGTVHAAPTISGTGAETVVINGSASNQPTIAYTNAASTITVLQTLTTAGQSYTSLVESQIDGEDITLTNGADLTIYGMALGTFYGNSGLTSSKGTMSGLHGATSSTASYDSHMVVSATGSDTLTVETIDESFGMITVGGTGDTLTIYNAIGGNQQALHGLINYGLITVGAGGVLDITEQAAVNSTTVANFYNAGWIEIAGGTADISATVLDGANTAASSTTIDGYLELSQGGDLILSNTVAAQEEVTFLDGANNTLQVAAGTLFSGTVNNFSSGDTLVVLGTGVSSVSLATSGTITDLVATTGSTATTIKLTGSTTSELIVGTNSAGDLVVSAGAATLTTGTSSLGSATLNSTVTHSGSTTITGSGTELKVYDSLAGNGTFVIENGATLALDNTIGNDASITVMFGTLGTATSPNELILNGSTAGFGGTITGFSGTDVIDLGASELPTLTASEGLVLSYNSTTGKLTVSETADSTGAVVASTMLEVLGTAGALLATGSFVALESANGVLIETAASQSGDSYSFSISSGTTGSFETPADWTGGVAPDDIIAAGETVTIASGIASVSSSGITDNGTILVASGFTDAGALTGTGSLTIAATGTASLTGSTSLASISDAGKLVLGGTEAGAITLASTGQATIASAYTGTGAITGTGTLTVASSVAATLAGSVSLASILDYGTIAVGTAAVSPINMEGNGAGSEVVLTTASSSPVLTNFGTTDKIVGAGMTVPEGDGLVLSYSTSTGVLTITETSSSGATVDTASVTVSGVTGSTLSSASFVALEGTSSVTIELASSISGESFTFTGAADTSFENPANWSGSVAPGDVIASGELVTVASGTASISSGGLTDNGFITVASSFVDTGSLTGTGTLAVAAAGSATLTGNSTLTSLTDAGKLVLGGTDAMAITLASGGQATIASGFSDSAAITGLGTLTVDSGVAATLAAGSSFAAVNEHGTLDLLGSLATGVNLEGDAAKSHVTLAGADLISGTHTLATSFSNFGKGDHIVLGTGNFSINSSSDVLTDSYANGALVVTDSTDGAVVTLAVSLASGDLASSISLNIAAGVLDISIPCYAAGTRLLGVDGEILVEDVKVGDEMVTVRENGPATAKVVWVGQRTIDLTRHPEPALVRPVRIQAGAFGPGLPERDLRLSPHHAVYWNGCLFEALSLVNGTTIVQEANTRRVTYHHIELEAHDVMLAEGLPAESFLDTGNKDMFEGQGAMQLHADFRAPAEARFCAPMIREGAALDALRAALNARAKAARAA